MFKLGNFILMVFVVAQTQLAGKREGLELVQRCRILGLLGLLYNLTTVMGTANVNP
jgi:hypothetical protein